METIWPIERIDSAFEPNFIFLLTPPNSGSTAIAQTFVNSSNVDQLHPRAEAQGLIEGLKSNDRWLPGKYVNEQSVRTVWLKKCIELKEQNQTQFFIEKSPPNMVRIDILQRLFPRNILIVNNRDPYATVSSILYRYTKNIDSFTVQERHDKISKIATGWITRSKLLKNLITTKKIPYLSYESFCKNPEKLQAILDNSIFAGKITLNFKKPVQVKKYKPQLINNFNQTQINRLSKSDIETVTNTLKNHSDILTFFDYNLI